MASLAEKQKTGHVTCPTLTKDVELRSAAYQWARARAQEWGPVIAFCLALFLRSPVLFISPRFWAEEGTIYFEKMQHVGRFGGILQVINGNFQLLTNLFVDLSYHAPLSLAPGVTTYLSLAVSIYSASLIATFLQGRGCSVWVASITCVFFALQAAGYEVFMSATNVQWVTSVIAFMILILPNVFASSFAAWKNYAALATCGLTGTTACILLPLFILRSLISRDRYSLFLSAILASETAIQIAVIFTHREDIHRSFEISASIPTAMSLQIVFANFLPVRTVDAIGSQIAATSTVGVLSMFQISLIGVFVVMGLAFLAFPRIGRRAVVLSTLALFFASFVNVLGSLGNPSAMMSGWAGSRYFFLGATILIVMVGAAFQGRSKLLGTSVVILLLSGISVNSWQSDWSRGSTSGPSFYKQLYACVGQETCQIEIWPSGWSHKYRVSQ